MRTNQQLKKQLSRRQLLKYALYTPLAAACPVLAVSGCTKRHQQKKKPNIILIVIDTLRADHLHCYGYYRSSTPNIDKLAAKATLFNNAIAASPWTLPSVASILTSQHPTVLGIHDKITVIDPGFPTLAEMLKQYDYTTCGIVSHSLLSAKLGFGPGFDVYDEQSSLGHGGISSPLVTTKAVSFLKERHKNPFFLFAHYFDPHYNYLLHDKYNYYPSYSGIIKSNYPIGQLWAIRHLLSQTDIDYLLALYDSEISFTDEYIGKLLHELENSRLYDDTIIILTADHGEEFMERGWIGHTITLHQELIHVPLIIKFPGCKPSVIPANVSHLDIIPTLFRLLQLKIPQGLEGRALELNNDSSIQPAPIFSETFNPQIHRPEPEPVGFRSVLLGDSKLIYNQINEKKQLYDLFVDPYEKNDLFSDSNEQSKKLEILLSKLIEYVETKQRHVPAPDSNELFTPDQRKLLESLGYL